MNNTLSILSGLLGSYGGNSTGSSKSLVSDAVRQSDPLYYGQSDVVDNWTDGTTTMKKKKQGSTWDQKTSADDSLSSMRQYPEDSLVAHIAPWEADLLSMLGGAGNVNKQTGLLQFGWGGGDGGDSDGSDSNSDGGVSGLGGGDEGNDGGFHDDRDSGFDGGVGDGDATGWGGKFSGGGDSSGSFSDQASDRYNSSTSDQGPIGKMFTGAYQSGLDMAAQSPSFAESMESMSPVDKAGYFSAVSALDSSPFGLETGLMRDTTPTSKASSMFSDAKMKQLTDSLNLGGVIDQGLMAAGYNTSPPTDVLSQTQMSTDDMYNKFFNKDWSSLNLTNFAGSTPQNAMSNDAFASYAVNSPVALSAMNAIRDMELAGMDVSGMGITSGNQGKHAPNSQHYSNNAVDVNTKANSKSYSDFTSAMEKAGYNRGDKLGFGSGENHHWQ